MSSLIETMARYALIAGVVLLAVAVPYLLWRHRPARGSGGKRGRLVVWGAALGASTVLAVVVVFTQVPFYEYLFGRHAQPLPWLPALNLVFLTPIALESLAWVFTVMSVFAVVNDKPSGRYERMMWAFSSVAAAVNAGHNISTGKAMTGLVLGGFSIAGPLLVHFALRWDREAQSDRTTDEFRQAALARAVFLLRRGAQVLRHPWNSWRTISIATNLGCTWDQAYRIALLGQYTAVKNVLRAQFVRSLPTVDDSGTTAVQNSEIEAVHGPIGEDVFPACTDPLVADLHAAQDPGALLAIWGEQDRSNQASARDAASDNEGARTGDNPVHDEASTDDARSEPARPSRSRKARKRTRRTARRARGAVRAHAERQEHIAARHWWECTNNGIDPRARSRREVADELGINITAVSRGFKMAESGAFPNPQGEA